MWECGTSRAFLPHFHQVALHTKKRSWSKSNSKRQRISSYIFYFQRFQHRLIFPFLFIFSYLLPYMLLNIHIHIKFSSFFSKRKKKKEKKQISFLLHHSAKTGELTQGTSTYTRTRCGHTHFIWFSLSILYSAFRLVTAGPLANSRLSVSLNFPRLRRLPGCQQ